MTFLNIPFRIKFFATSIYFKRFMTVDLTHYGSPHYDMSQSVFMHLSFCLNHSELLISFKLFVTIYMRWNSDIGYVTFSKYHFPISVFRISLSAPFIFYGCLLTVDLLDRKIQNVGSQKLKNCLRNSLPSSFCLLNFRLRKLILF